MVIRKPRPSYPRQGPSCLLLLAFVAIFGLGLYVIVNADTVRDTFTPTPTPAPTRSAVDLAVSADLHARDGEYAQAIESYEQALFLDGTRVAIYISLVDLLIAEGEAARALDWAEKANLLAPDNSQVWALKAAAHIANGDRLLASGELVEADKQYSESIRAAREAIRIDPEFGRAYAYWASAIVSQSGVDGVVEAAEQVEIALLYAPDDPLVRRAQGQVLEQQGLYAAALEQYQIAVDLTRNPKELAQLHIAQAYNSFALRNLPDAILYFEDALALDPDNADALDGLAFMYFLLGEYPRAEEFATQARDLDPEMVRAYAHLGAALFRQNNYAPAIENLEFAVERYRNVTVSNSTYFVMLGFAYIFERNDCARARVLFEKVLTALPDDPNALEGLDSCRGQ